VQAIYYAKNIALAAGNGNTVTVTFKKATSGAELRIAEYAGLSTTMPLDVSVAGYWTGQTSIPSANSGGVSTGNAHDLLVGAGTTNQSIAGSGTNYTSRMITSTGILEDREVTATGRYSADAPLGFRSGPNVITWVMQMIALRAAH
jgi:hypothetical protein